MTDAFSDHFEGWKHDVQRFALHSGLPRDFTTLARESYERLVLDEWMSIAAPTHIGALAKACCDSGKSRTAVLLGDLMAHLDSDPSKADAASDIVKQLHTFGDLSAVLHDPGIQAVGYSSVLSRFLFVTAPVVATCNSPSSMFLAT